MRARRQRVEALTVGLALAAATFLVFVVRPYLRILALDYHTLVHSFRVLIYGGTIISDEVVGWGEVALMGGAWPWLLLVLTGAVLGVRARLLPGQGWVLGDGSRPLRWLLALIALAPLALFAVPFALALSVWLMVEAFWWIQWRGEMDAHMAFLLDASVVVFVPGTLLAGLGGVWFALRDRRKGRNWRSRRQVWIRRAVGGLVVGPVVLANVALGLGIFHHALNAWRALGKIGLYQSRCGECHAPAAPLLNVYTPEEWRYRMEKTHLRTKANLSDDEMEEVFTFIRGMRSFTDAWTFRSRCQRCHFVSYLSWDDRHPEDWEMIVDRVGRYAPPYYEPAVKRQVVSYLSEAYGSEDEGPGIHGEAYQRARALIRRCSSCHYVSRRAGANQAISEEQALRLVARMSSKMVQPLSDDEVRRFAETYREIVADPERLRRLVPHDRPMLTGGLPW